MYIITHKKIILDWFEFTSTYYKLCQRTMALKKKLLPLNHWLEFPLMYSNKLQQITLALADFWFFREKQKLNKLLLSQYYSNLCS